MSRGFGVRLRVSLALERSLAGEASELELVDVGELSGVAGFLGELLGRLQYCALIVDGVDSEGKKMKLI